LRNRTVVLRSSAQNLYVIILYIKFKNAIGLFKLICSFFMSAMCPVGIHIIRILKAGHNLRILRDWGKTRGSVDG
jgi:hypothetical protein